MTAPDGPVVDVCGVCGIHSFIHSSFADDSPTNATGARERRPSVDGVAMAPYVPTGRKRGRPRDPNKKRPPKPGPPPEALRVREEDARASESDDESDDERGD